MMLQKHQIVVKGEDKTESIRSWQRNGDKINITYNNGKTYSYSTNNIHFVENALNSPTSTKCFEYLKKVAQVIGLKDSQGNNILADRFNKIDYISPESILSAFLLGRIDHTKTTQISHNQKNIYQPIVVFPFGFNISQEKAIVNALASPLSIIEGPPGTGKTQTILNIIANAVMRGESVAIVSSNNSATANIQEKLEKYQVDFISAYLGNKDNKIEFINSQKPLPEFKNWIMSQEQEREISKLLLSSYLKLSDMLTKKNKVSQLRQELENIDIEYKHFIEYYTESHTPQPPFSVKLASVDALDLWLLCEKYVARGKLPGWFERLINRFKYGIKDKPFYRISPEAMISICQKQYYQLKLEELHSAINKLDNELKSFHFEDKMLQYSQISAQVLRSYLASKYEKIKRKHFCIDDLWRNSEDFIKEYPVILSTTYSLRSSLSHKVMYDYVIVDEASQVDLATGALAFSCAKKAVIVGDLKQLPNVVDSTTARQTDAVFDEFGLSEVYRYKNHSLLLAVIELFPDAPKILLREHYRCHPKIIEFCNQKFYNGELIVLTEKHTDRQPLIVYTTVEGNHAREHINQRQIDVIKNEIIPQQKLDTLRGSIGIVTPYRNQTNALQKAFAGTSIKADTVDKFQGRENDIVILSTVDNEISEFADNANRLNVAVSRAIQQLIVVVNNNDLERDTNISDLVRYIRYNNMEVIRSEIYSVFDYLFKNYRDKRIAILKESERVSDFDSENLMYKIIRELLNSNIYYKFDVAVHVPLKMIIRNPSKLNDIETKYAMNILTHVDFLIFDKLSRTPRLIIEVDGISYHNEGTRQAERDMIKNTILQKYNLPYVRFRTDESGERERLRIALNNLI